MLKNLVFDMGGVLVDLNKQACIDAFVSLGFSDIEHYIGEFQQSELFFAFEEGTISTPHFLQTISQQLGGEVTEDAIKQAWLAFLISIPQQKLEQIRELRKRYRVFLLSNTNDIHFNHICQTYFLADNHTLDNYFEKCYLSYQLHMSKPSHEIFEYLLRDANILASETLFIDDGEANVQTAKLLGFHTYHAHPFEDFTPLFNDLMTDK